MELYDLVILGCFSAVISGIFSIGAAMLMQYLSDKSVKNQLSEHAGAIESLQKASYGQRGASVKQEKSERVNAALAKAAILLKEGKQPIEIMKQVASEYPDVAMDLVKKGGISL